MNEQAQSRESELGNRRKVQDERADENTAPTFYLDLLPVEVLDHLLIFFSRLPNGDRWENHIPLNHIIGLYGIDTGSWFESWMKSRFDTLCISSSIDCAFENELYGWKLKRGRMLWTDDDELAFAFVSAGGGDHLHSLIVGIDMDSEEMAAEFRHYCPNLKSLSIADGVSGWTSTFGGQLEKLEYGNHMPLEISTQSLNLKELTLSVHDRLVESNLWELVGGTLESLTVLSDFGVQIADTDNIEKYCRNLRRISIDIVSRDGNSALSALLASFGGQLQWAKISDFNEIQLLRVARSCSNARFHLHHAVPHEMEPAVQILGAQIENITITNIGCDPSPSGFSAEWRKCINLREISFNRAIPEIIRQIFSSPKPHLEEFTTDCGGLKRAWSSLAQFLELNKSSLSHVALCLPYSNTKVGEAIRILLQGSSLQEIRCVDSPPKKLLKTLEKRGIQCRGWDGTIYYSECGTAAGRFRTCKCCGVEFYR